MKLPLAVEAFQFGRFVASWHGRLTADYAFCMMTCLLAALARCTRECEFCGKPSGHMFAVVAWGSDCTSKHEPLLNYGGILLVVKLWRAARNPTPLAGALYRILQKSTSPQGCTFMESGLKSELLSLMTLSCNSWPGLRVSCQS